jgi:hypothetical protein
VSHLDGGIEDLAHVDRFHLLAVRAREGLQVLDDVAHALGAGARFAQRALQLIEAVRQVAEHVGQVVHDVHERVVDLVCDAGGEHAHAGEALGLRELSFHLLAFADLARDQHQIILADEAAQLDGDLDREGRAVFAAKQLLGGQAIFPQLVQ